MTTIRVNLGERSYDIRITSGDPRGLGPFARERSRGSLAFVVADENVRPHAEAAADALAAAGLAAMLGVVALLGAAAARRSADGRRLVLASLAAVAAFAALGKVLSPQYLLWLVPLGALAYAWRLHALAAAVALAAVLTQVEFPARYFDVVDREPFAIAVVALRNLVLLAAVALAVRALHARGHQELLDRRRPAVAVGLDQ
jgi:MFS family permease